MEVKIIVHRINCGLKDIKSMQLEELKKEFVELGFEEYRASQVYGWLNSGVSSFDLMTNLSVEFRAKLKSMYFIANVKIKQKFKSANDGTIKYLFELFDGELIESVLMKYKHGNTVCVSSQVGCKMGCSFCATAGLGFSRNLLASEMLSQIHAVQIDNNIKVTNVVLMGMGEPLNNYDNVVRFLKLVSSKNGLNISLRHVSVSTCGLADKIYVLANENLPLALSISLHAPDDKTRSELMPINKKWGVIELLKACRYYVNKTGRRISFEYAMIDGVNDSASCARKLIKLVSGLLCHVNLIPLNGTHSKYKKSTDNSIHRFMDILIKNGVNTTVRRTLGADINAACGQLRRIITA